jgi:hypothetical protein
MRSPRLFRFIAVLATLAAGGSLVAQTAPRTQRPSPPTPAAPPSDPSAAAATAPAAPSGAPRSAAESTFNALGTGNLESNTLLQIINKAFDTDSDAFNPEDGTLSYKGHTYNLGQMRAFRARFERYLAQPESIDNDVYRAILNEIFSLLSTRTGEASAETTRRAWQLLYRASEYDADGGASLAVANQVFNAWRIRDERDALSVTSAELDRIRRQQQLAVSFAGDTMAREGVTNAASMVTAAGNAVTDSAAAAAPAINVGNTTGNSTSGGNSTANNNQRRTNNGNGSNPRSAGTGGNSTSGSGAIGVTPTQGPVSQMFRARELAETEAKIRATETSAILTGVQAKLQFQAAIVNLFLQRRFQHCLIAASFYRYIFKGSAQNLEVGKKEIQSFLPSSDLALTVETLEFLSREAINDTEASMQAVRASFTDGQLVSALERLQETFFLGEYTPAVAGFEREKKQVLLNLYRQIDQARKLADLKDYDAVDKLVAELSTTAKDFRSSEVVSALRAAQRMSTLALYAAQQAAATGDFIRAQEGVQRAASLWPLNPAIKTYTENMANQVDLGSQAALLFDDALKRNDFRRLYDQRSELAIALLSDAVRGPRLREIIETLSRVEIFLAQAHELVAQNNAFAAWEALDAASALTPNDVQVNQRRADLAPRVANFVGRIDAAKRHEEAGRQAAALTQWLAAQSIYPASSLARLGIERVSKRLLDDLELDAENTAAKNAAKAEAAAAK